MTHKLTTNLRGFAGKTNLSHARKGLQEETHGMVPSPEFPVVLRVTTDVMITVQYWHVVLRIIKQL